MAIKIYQSQIRPTEEIGAVETTPGMRVSMETAAALGAASSKFTQGITDFVLEKEKIKAETEVLEKKEKIYNGDENVPGLSKVKDEASKMEDPDEADKYYKEQFKTIQDYHTKDTKNFFTKRVLGTFLQKQSVEDSILIRNSATNNLLERNRLAVEANTDRLKKSIVYGKTDLEISNATNELDTILNSDVYNKVYGKKAAEEKNKVREDVDYYKGLRTLDRDPMKINDVIKDSTLPIEKIEKLRSHAKLSALKIDETSGNNLKDYEAQIDKGNDPGINALNAAKERSIAVDNFDNARKIDALIEKRNVILNIRSKSLSEMDAEISKMETMITTSKAENKDVPIAELKKYEIVKKFKADLQTDLEKDLLRTASERNIVTLNNINFNDVMLNPSEENKKVFTESLAARKNSATTAGKYYNLPTRFFTDAESKQLKAIVEKSTDSKMLLELASNMANGFGADAPNAFAEISKENALFAHVGGITMFNGGIPTKGASDAIEGYLLSKNKNITLTDFSRKNTQSLISGYQKAFTGIPAETFNRVIETADNIYIKRTFDANKLTSAFNLTLYEEALNDAVGSLKSNGKQFGGFDKYNDLTVIIPAYIKKGNFSTIVDYLEKNENILKKSGSYKDPQGNTVETLPLDKNGKEINIFKEKKGFFTDPYFVTVGPGRYKISLSKPFGSNVQPEYLLNKNGGYFIVDLNKIKGDLGTVNK
jgi:hypothetical protein